MLAYLIIHSATGNSQVCLNILSCLNSLHKFLQIFPQDQHRKCKNIFRLCLDQSEYFVKYELCPHPDTHCPPPRILFRPHEYSLYAPLDTFCLWSPQKPHSNIPAMLTAYAHSHTTHVHLFTLQCRPAVGMDESYKMVKCEHVSERFGFIVETQGLTCCKMIACVSKDVFFFFTLEYVYWFCYKIEKKIAWCYITLHGELSKKHKKCSENAL